MSSLLTRMGRPAKKHYRKIITAIPPLQEMTQEQKDLLKEEEEAPILDHFSLTPENRIICEQYFERMMIGFQSEPISKCFPPILQEMFSAISVIIWIPNEHLTKFVSPELKVEVNGENSLFSAVSKSKTAMIVCSLEPTAPIEILENEPKSPQFIFPLFLTSGHIVCVAEIIRHVSSNSFEDIDIRFANFIMEKFMLYGTNFVRASQILDFNFQFCQITTLANILPTFQESLRAAFGGERCEFWIKKQKNAYKFINIQFSFVEHQNVGVITESMRTREPLLVKTARFHPCFSFKGDESADSSVICVPQQTKDEELFLIVIRRTSQQQQFDGTDLYKLTLVAPFILRSFEASEEISSAREDPDSITARIKELLAETKVLFSSNNIREIIIKKAKKLCRCDEATFDEPTKSGNVISNPIYDDNLKVVGNFSITNSSKFNNDDIKIGNAWTTFSNIRLQQDALYKALTNFLEELFAKPISKILDYLTILKNSIHATRITLFVRSVFDNKLTQAYCVGSNDFFPSEQAEKCLEDMNQFYYIIEKKQRNKLLALQDDAEYTQAYDKFCILTPVGKISAIEAEIEDVANDTKIEMFKDFSLIAANLLNKHCSSEISMIGDEGYLMSNYITAEEGRSFEIPEKLKIENVFEASFSTQSLDNIGLIRACFAIFESFNIMKEMNVNALTLMRFFYRISLRSSLAENKDFRHSVNSALFAAKVINTSKFNFTKLQVYCLLVAALCHDIDSERVPEKYAQKSSTAISELRIRQSVLEALSVDTFYSLSDSCHLFSEDNKKEAEDLVKTLILGTSATKHFFYIDMIKEETEGKSFDENPIPYMILIMKCCDYSIYTEDYSLLEKQLYIVSDEFYESGDLTKIPPLQYTVFSKQRECIDKKASAGIFFFNVVVPIFELASTKIDNFKVFYDNVMKNGEKIAQLTPEDI